MLLDSRGRRVEAARARPWADLGGIGEPPPLPPPPSAALWWAAAAASLLLTAGFSAATLLPQAPSPDTPVVAAFTQTGAGWSARFDTHDRHRGRGHPRRR